MEEQNFDMMLSLKDMAMRMVVVNFWKQPDILCRFHHRFIPPSFQSVRGIEMKITEKMSELMCPESLKKEIRTIVAPIGIQIENWIKFHEQYLENLDWRQVLEEYSIDSHVKLHLPILKKLSFTSVGTIDYRKTAQELIHYEMLDVVKLYQLACLYCLDDAIPLLWQEIPEKIKNMFCKIQLFQYESSLWRELPDDMRTMLHAEGSGFRIDNSFDLQFCWPYILMGELSELDCISYQSHGLPTTFYRHAFELTSQEGNRSAAQYFFEKLTPTERNDCLAQFDFVNELQDLYVEKPTLKFPLENKTDNFCYFFSRMNREQQLKLFKRHCLTILYFLLDWPWQELCLNLTNLFRAFIVEEEYEYLLKKMYVFSSGLKYPFGKLFQDFFPRCSANFRRDFVTRRSSGAPFLYEIFNFEDSESAKVMFRNLCPADRMRFVSSDHFFELLHHNILLNNLNMIKLCLYEASLSKVRREKLKVAFVAFGAANKDRIKLQAQVQNQFSQLLDQIYDGNKRSLELKTPNKPSFDMMLSLKDMAMRKVVVNFWKQPDILCRFHHRFIPPSFRSVRGIEMKITEKMLELFCPESLKKEINTNVVPIGIQIEKWIKFHEYYLLNLDWRQVLEKYSIDSHVKLYLPVLKKLVFTSAGMIDYCKTAQELIHYKMLDVVKLYQLACLYCLDDSIPLLWQEIPEEIRTMFYKKERQFRIENSFDLQFCWPYILNGKLSKLNRISSRCCGHSTTFQLHAFKFTVKEGNKSAAKYFFENLTQKKKNRFLARFKFVDELQGQFLGRPALTYHKFSLENKTDLFCYFFSQRNRKQQLKLFKKYTRTILTFLLDWPWHELCLKLTNLFRAYISEEDYKYLLKQMYVCSSESKYPFGKLFQDFFPRCSANFRRDFVTRRSSSAHFLNEIFNIEDSKSAKVMFRNLCAVDRLRFVSSDHFFELLHHNILLNKLNMIKLCLYEASLSKERREKLKVAFVAFGAANRDRIKLQAQVQNQFSQLLDQIYVKNKRGLEGETSSNPKKLCLK